MSIRGGLNWLLILSNIGLFISCFGLPGYTVTVNLIYTIDEWQEGRDILCTLDLFDVAARQNKAITVVLFLVYSKSEVSVAVYHCDWRNVSLPVTNTSFLCAR
jgi:hypothetical protein